MLTSHEGPHGTDEVYYADFYADILLAITVSVLVERLLVSGTGVLGLNRRPADYTTCMREKRLGKTGDALRARKRSSLSTAMALIRSSATYMIVPMVSIVVVRGLVTPVTLIQRDSFSVAPKMSLTWCRLAGRLHSQRSAWNSRRRLDPLRCNFDHVR